MISSSNSGKTSRRMLNKLITPTTTSAIISVFMAGVLRIARRISSIMSEQSPRRQRGACRAVCPAIPAARRAFRAARPPFLLPPRSAARRQWRRPDGAVSYPQGPGPSHPGCGDYEERSYLACHRRRAIRDCLAGSPARALRADRRPVAHEWPTAHTCHASMSEGRPSGASKKRPPGTLGNRAGFQQVRGTVPCGFVRRARCLHSVTSVPAIQTLGLARDSAPSLVLGEDDRPAVPPNYVADPRIRGRADATATRALPCANGSGLRWPKYLRAIAGLHPAGRRHRARPTH